MTGDGAIIGIFAGAFLVVLCLVMVFGGGVGRRYRRRIDRVRARTLTLAGAPAAPRDLKRREGGASGIERFLAGFLPRREALRVRLRRAGLGLSPGRYAAITVLAGLLVFVAFNIAFGLAAPLAALAALALGIMGPHMVVSRMIARRLARFNQFFPEAIDLMVRGLKSGLPISETIANVGQDMPDPVGIEFRAIADAVRLGATLDEAMWDAARRIDLPEFKFFTISLSVQRETGGNLGETLNNLADILRKRQTMRLKVRAMSSEARASAYIIGSLPFIMFAILWLMNPEYVMRLFTDPRGLIMVGGGLFMMGLGSAVMFKMVRFEI
ncbi:MAG: hypothetical protein RL477_1878 [Pseudomonadota bacterium]